jgi:hypothetical protein
MMRFVIMKWDMLWAFHTWVLVTPMMLKVIETVLHLKIWNLGSMVHARYNYIAQPGDKNVRFIRQMGP